MTAPIRYLVFLEFLDEAKTFLKYYREELQASPQDFQIITFHPSVKWFLNKNNIAARESFRFAPTAAHQKILLKVEDCANQIRQDCHLTDAQGVNGIYVENLFHSLFQMFSQWFYQIHIVAAAVEHYGPQEIITVGTRQPLVVRGLWVERQERLLANIASQISAPRGIGFKLIAQRPFYHLGAASCAEAIKDFWKGVLFGVIRFCSRPKKKIIAAPALGYNIDGVLRDLQKELSTEYDVVILDAPLAKGIKFFLDEVFGRGPAVCRFFPANADRRIPLSSDFVRQKQEFRRRLFAVFDEKCHEAGVSFAPWMKDKYQYAFEPEIIDKTYFLSVNLNRFFDRFRPAFVLAQYSRDLSAVMGVVSRNQGIPSLMMPHGSFTALYDEFSKIDWKQNAFGMVNTPYEYLALQTPLMEDFLAEMPVNSKLVVTGPLIFGRRIQRPAQHTATLRGQYAPHGEKIILHAGTPKFRRGQRLINYETLEEYVDGITMLIQTVDRLKGVHLIVRYREIDGLTVAELKNLLPTSAAYSIAAGGSFSEYLTLADLLVSYSSTTIEEALQNNVPVLLFNPYQRYQHIKGVELASGKEPRGPSAVYNVNSPEDLTFALEWVFKNHPFQEEGHQLFEKYQYKPDEIVRLSDFIRDANFRESSVKNITPHLYPLPEGERV